MSARCGKCPSLANLFLHTGDSVLRLNKLEAEADRLAKENEALKKRIRALVADRERDGGAIKADPAGNLN